MSKTIDELRSYYELLGYKLLDQRKVHVDGLDFVVFLVRRLEADNNYTQVDICVPSHYHSLGEVPIFASDHPSKDGYKMVSFEKVSKEAEKYLGNLSEKVFLAAFPELCKSGLFQRQGMAVFPSWFGYPSDQLISMFGY